MTVYESPNGETGESTNGSLDDSLDSAYSLSSATQKAKKPSLLSRIRRALTPKMAVWLITQAGDDDSVIYAAPTKKDAFLAADALVFRHFFPHYSSWLPLHGYGDPNSSDSSDMSGYGIRSDAWRKYLSANPEEADEYLATLEIRRAFYDRRAFTSMIRIMCGVAPLGLDFETPEEIEYWFSAVVGSVAAPGSRTPSGQSEDPEKDTSPLDNASEEMHNRDGHENTSGADPDSNTGYPHGKAGSHKKTPGTSKGDPNGK